MTRTDALQALLRLDRPLDEITSVLGQYPWDSETELVVLSCADVAIVLERFISGGLTAIEVENWADAIECRDDIGFETKSMKLLKEVVRELANPVLTTELTQHSARSLLNRLSLKVEG